MEKWKIVLIGLLLVGLFGYGAFTQAPTFTSVGGAPTPTPTSEVASWIGKPLPPWNPARERTWINVPAPLKPTVLKGHVSLVEFFRILCPHCQEAAPLMVAINHRFGPRGLQIVTFQSPGQYADPTVIENNWTTVQGWCKDKGIDYPVAFDAGSTYFQKQLSGKYYPTVLILNPQGVVVFGHTGHDPDKGLDLVAALEKQFPSPGTIAQRAEATALWLKNIPEYASSDSPAFRAAIVTRLMGQKK